PRIPNPESRIPNRESVSNRGFGVGLSSAGTRGVDFDGVCDAGYRDSDLVEAVAQADYRFNLLSRRAELRTQAPHVHIHRPRFDEAVVSPRPLEQPVAREDAIPVFDEETEELELAPRQFHRLRVDRHGDRVEIGDQVFAGVTRLARFIGRRAAAA